MISPLQSWLHQIASRTGVLACGIRHPRGHCVSQSRSSHLPSAKLDDLWNQLSEAIKTFQLRRIAVERLCWKFEHCHLCYALRPDGIAFGVILKPPAGHSQAQFHRLIREFLDQDWRLAA